MDHNLGYSTLTAKLSAKIQRSSSGHICTLELFSSRRTLDFINRTGIHATGGKFSSLWTTYSTSMILCIQREDCLSLVRLSSASRIGPQSFDKCPLPHPLYLHPYLLCCVRFNIATNHGAGKESFLAKTKIGQLNQVLKSTKL